MSDITMAERQLRHGASYPYDAPDEWWNGNGDAPPPATDWAHAAVRGIIVDLEDRHTIKHGFAGVDEDTRAEIVASLAEIVRRAYQLAASREDSK